MAKEESSSSSAHVPIPTTLDMCTSQYKKTVEDMSTEMINIHTSMLAANEEIMRLIVKDSELSKRNDELELMLISLELIKQKAFSDQPLLTQY